MEEIYVRFKKSGKSRLLQGTLNSLVILPSRMQILLHFLHYILILVELILYTQLGSLFVSFSIILQTFPHLVNKES